MSFSENEMDDIISDFITESMESLESLDQKFIELEKNPSDTTLLNEIFRSVHTIKGAAGFLGFQQIVDVTHVSEDILNKLRKGEMLVNAAIMDAILQAIDVIKAMIVNLRDKSVTPIEIQPVVALLNDVLKGNFKEAETIEKKEVETLFSKEIEAAKAQVKPEEAAASKEKEKEQSIRVDIERLDSVMNLIGELVLARNRMMVLGTKLNAWNAENELVTQMDEGISQLDLVTTDLQLAVMKMRMQPIAKVFNKFPRMVRDLARQSNKEIELVITGEETEIDKTVIEEIGDPLVHLVRNSVDHGLETREDRAAAGKNPVGTIRLVAYQEGQHIVISVSDDGKGIDPARIKKSAVEKGLITQAEADNLGVREALNLIFIPGFSTAKVVSNISGRGVGMDVVKTNITKINGTISIDSEVGRGSAMTFRLPLTLAIIQVLTVEAGGEYYGIPLSMVIENIRVRREEIKNVDGKEVINIRDRVFPLVRLGKLVSSRDALDASQWQYIVLLGIGEKNVGIVVDRLQGQEEIVMKSMGEYLKGTAGVAGACINGDGNVILVLDVAGLVAAAC